MHNPSRFFASTADLFANPENLERRDFFKTLFNFATEKCVSFLGDDIKSNEENLKYCRNELMVASSCVLLNKVNTQVGDQKDNIGLCRHEIDLVKEKLKEKFNDFPNKKLDQWLFNLNFSTKSFV
jgi:hypothetical protein